MFVESNCTEQYSSRAAALLSPMGRTTNDNSTQKQPAFSGLKRDRSPVYFHTYNLAKIPVSCSSKPKDAHVNIGVALLQSRN